MTDMRSVADGAMGAIFSSHNIEHLYPHEVPQALAEFLRMLSGDGFAVITCPDLKSVCVLVAEVKLTEPAYTSPVGPIAQLDILHGHRAPMARGNLFMAHRCGFTEKVLRATLQAAGFRAVLPRARGRRGLRTRQAMDRWTMRLRRTGSARGQRAATRLRCPQPPPSTTCPQPSTIEEGGGEGARTTTDLRVAFLREPTRTAE